MTSFEQAIKPGGIFDEPIDLDDCNPLLLKQLEQQAVEARRPRVLRGCETRIDRQSNTIDITVSSGLVFASDRYLAFTKARSFKLNHPGIREYRIDAIVLTDGRDKPVVRVVKGTSAVYPLMPSLPVGAQGLAWLVIHRRVTLHTDIASVEAEQKRLVEAEVKRIEARRESQQELERCCLHNSTVITDMTQLGDAENRYGIHCRGCGKSWAEYECGRCGKRNRKPRSCPCRTNKTITVTAWTNAFDTAQVKRELEFRGVIDLCGLTARSPGPP